jgi:hypothetical protein
MDDVFFALLSAVAELDRGGPAKHPLSGFRRRCSFPNDSVAGCDESPDSSITLTQSLSALDPLCAMLRDPLAI